VTAATLAPPHPQAASAARVLCQGRYEDLVECADCGEPFRRAKGATYAACLGCQTARRLADAGIALDDPVLRRWAAWNAAVSRGRRA
jgi:hypothetical protein